MPRLLAGVSTPGSESVLQNKQENVTQVSESRMKWHLKGTYVYATFRVTCAESQLSLTQQVTQLCPGPKGSPAGQGGMHRWLKPLPWLKGRFLGGSSLGGAVPPLIPAALLATQLGLASLPGQRGLLVSQVSVMVFDTT